MDKLVEKIDRGDMFVELGTFKEGKNKPFSFYVPQGKTVEGLTAHLDKVTKGKGKETLLVLANANLFFRFRGKANAQISEDKDREAALAAGKTLLISEEDAMTYEPSSREAYSEGGLLRARTEALKQAVEAKKKGDEAAYQDYVKKAIDIAKQLDELAVAAFTAAGISTS